MLWKQTIQETKKLVKNHGIRNLVESLEQVEPSTQKIETRTKEMVENIRGGGKR
jgi:uncharacterized protein (UPF0335 family)